MIKLHDKMHCFFEDHHVTLGCLAYKTTLHLVLLKKNSTHLQTVFYNKIKKSCT